MERKFSDFGETNKINGAWTGVSLKIFSITCALVLM